MDDAEARRRDAEDNLNKAMREYHKASVEAGKLAGKQWAEQLQVGLAETFGFKGPLFPDDV